MSFILSWARFSPVFAPIRDDGGNGGGDTADDNIIDDVEAAYAELEGDDGAGNGSDGLGDGGEPRREAPRREAARERDPSRQARRDGERTETEGDETADRGDGRTRRGQFARDDAGRQRRPADNQDPAAAAAAAAAREPADGERGGGEVAIVAPPPSYSPLSKATWDQFKAAFPHIAADISKRETEVSQGYAALKDYKDLAPYAKMATDSGTTLSAALQRYTNLEQLAHRNPVDGMIAMCKGLRLTQEQAGEVLMQAAQAVGAKIPVPAPRIETGGQGGANGAGGDRNPSGAFMEAMTPILAPLLQRLDQVQTHINGFAEADRNAKEKSLDIALDAFSRDAKNVFFNDVEDTMTSLFANKMVPLTGNHAADLQTCYEMACRVHPEVSEALIEKRIAGKGDVRRQREQRDADRARAASRSLAGSEIPDLEPADRRQRRKGGDSKQSQDEDRYGDVAAAYDQVAADRAY